MTRAKWRKKINEWPISYGISCIIIYNIFVLSQIISIHIFNIGIFYENSSLLGIRMRQRIRTREI